MESPPFDVVTGAFGFSGRSIGRRLLASGRRVLTLTSKSPDDAELAGSISIAPFNLDDPDRLVESIRGAETLFNTYWIRFERGDMTFERAVENSRTLIRAAKEAEVRRFVHVSIANPSSDSPLPYYRGKALIEEALRESGLSYAILRPAVLFGDQGILINNIAWFLRRFPAFAVPGRGDYGMQPIHVEDLADLAVKAASGVGDVTTDAVGPETYAFGDLLRLMKSVVGSRALILHAPPAMVLVFTAILGRMIGDVILTPDEVKGLMANLLVSDQPPTASTRLSDWLRENASWLGTRYMSELRRHYRTR